MLTLSTGSWSARYGNKSEHESQGIIHDKSGCALSQRYGTTKTTFTCAACAICAMVLMFAAACAASLAWVRSFQPRRITTWAGGLMDVHSNGNLGSEGTPSKPWQTFEPSRIDGNTASISSVRFPNHPPLMSPLARKNESRLQPPMMESPTNTVPERRLPDCGAAEFTDDPELPQPAR